VAGTLTNGAESDARTIVALSQELAELGVRALELELRISGLESDRWKAFSLVELEWITNGFLQAPDEEEWNGNVLAEQANAELVRRARGTPGIE
jgi:hypothetical protein